jgi:hypothetical protein
MDDSSENHRRFLEILSDKGRIKRNHALSKRFGQKLIDLEIAQIQRDGRSDYIVVIRLENFQNYVFKRFPGGLYVTPNSRLGGVLLRGNSKLGGNAGHGIITCRVFSGTSTHHLSFDAKKITEDLGVLSAAIHTENGVGFQISGSVVIVENLDVFMAIEHIIPGMDVAIYSGGILDSRIIGWLNNCNQISSVLHAGDYDATGLKEFMRYERELKHSVNFYVHDSITIDDFKRYGRAELVGKGRNLSLMDGIRKHETEDEGFNRSIRFILDSGNGLEQEFLLSL